MLLFLAGADPDNKVDPAGHSAEIQEAFRLAREERLARQMQRLIKAA